MYCPEEHREHESWLGAEAAYPFAHTVQDAMLPERSLYLPVGQAKQDTDPAAATIPVEQATHAELSEEAYFPASQVVHEGEPLVATVPGSQFAQEPAPYQLLLVPASH